MGSCRRKKKWEITEDKLFLAFKTSNIFKCTKHVYADALDVLVVDVASEYKQEIPYAKPEDNNARTIMFFGEKGCGKTTQINAFLSYLLGGDLDDSHRILLIDDPNRKCTQSQPETPYITIYKIRPIADSFYGCTFYIIDIPAYCDAETLHTGRNWDEFMTASMEVIVKALPKVNSLVLILKSGETRAAAGTRAVIASIFHLFPENVRQCLGTIFTFSDVFTLPTKTVLENLDWPLDSGTVVEVNNSAFRIAGVGNKDDQKVRSRWRFSMEGQQEVARMLRCMKSVPTYKKAKVTHQKFSLTSTYTNIENKVFQTAVETAKVLMHLDLIQEAIGVSSKKKFQSKKSR